MISGPLKSASMAWVALALVTCSHTEDPPKTPQLSRICEFPEVLNENSGITEYQDILWNINDGGNEAALYGVSAKDSNVLRKVMIRSAANTDWEDITQDDRHLYIGDFGNNLGDRKDLRIYILNKSDLVTIADTIPVAGVITYSYENQTDFTAAANYSTQWDCEAFVVVDDSMILFTKDWKTQQTSLYTLPAKAGDFKARLRKQYNISGLVTAAAYSKVKNELLILGYNGSLNPFICVVPDFSLNNFSFSDTRKINFEPGGLQTEGIAWSADGSVYVTSEKSPFGNSGPILFKASDIP